MARPKVELQIPKDLGLNRKQMSDLTKSFEKQLLETLKGKEATSKKAAKTKQIVVDVRAKSKSEIV